MKSFRRRPRSLDSGAGSPSSTSVKSAPANTKGALPRQLDVAEPGGPSGRRLLQLKEMALAGSRTSALASYRQMAPFASERPAGRVQGGVGRPLAVHQRPMQMIGGPLKPVQEVELRQTVNGWNEDQSRALYAWCRNWKQLRSIRANMSPDLWGIIARYYATGDKLPVKAAEIEGALNGRVRADFLDARHGISAVEPELHDAMGKSRHPSGRHVFDQFDKRQAWRLLMDGKHHDTRGKYGFENEQGYMSAMMAAFTFMLGQIGTKMDEHLYEALHDRAVMGVLTRSGNPMGRGYRDRWWAGVGFGLDPENWSAEGAAELHDRWKKDAPIRRAVDKDTNKMVGPEVREKVMLLKGLYKSQCQGLVRDVLETYYTRIAAIKKHYAKPQNRSRRTTDKPDEILTAIVRLAQDLDQMHLFFDGNIRTVAFLVLNKLLIDNEMKPAILDEPNVFDMKSTAELVAAVKAGQAEFAKYEAKSVAR